MKKLFLFLTIAVITVFAQHRSMGPHYSYRPPVVIRPYSNFGHYSWNSYYGYGYGSYYPWFYTNSGEIMYRQPQPCKKETLKDSNGVKHQILVCVQPDGTIQTVDANTLIPAK